MDNRTHISGIKIVKDNVEFNFSGGPTQNFSMIWLRDNCRCEKCYDTTTFQRINHILDLPQNSQIVKYNISESKNSAIFFWDDGHKTECDVDFLLSCSKSNWLRRNKVFRRLWRGDECKFEIAAVDRDDFLKSEETLTKFLKSLVVYGVAFVDNVHPTVEDTELVIRRVAPPQRTLFGDMWSFTSNQARADTAYTKIPLAVHSDNTYFTEAAGLQVLHCIEHDGTGGENTLVDGFYGAEELLKNNVNAFNLLSTELQPAEYLEDGWNYTHYAPIISINPFTKQLQQIRFNVYDRSSVIMLDDEKIRPYYSAIIELAKLYCRTEVEWKLKLNPGRVMFFDNWRILHGRLGFTGTRVVGGSYISRGDWLSAARIRGLL